MNMLQRSKAMLLFALFWFGALEIIEYADFLTAPKSRQSSVVMRSTGKITEGANGGNAGGH